MHGRKRTTVSENEKVAQAQKAATYLSLVNLVIDKITAREYTPEAFSLTSKMIKANPDFYSLWNYRREMLIHFHGEQLGLSNDIPTTKIASDIGAAVRESELEISADGIKKNSKSCRK